MTLKKLKIVGKTLFIMLFPLFVATQSFAQVANSGKEFYVAFGKNDTITTVKNLWYQNGEYVVQGNSVDLILRITAIADTEVTLSFTENSALNTTITVAGGEIRDYHLTADQARAAYSGHNINAYNNKKSIRITATEPVNIVAMSTAYASTEATLVWPVETWGTEYYNTGLNTYRTSDYNGYILIAKEDGTTFTHTSPTNSFTHTLNAGELYYAASSNSNNFYYRGAHVVSNKPVAFFNTNTSGRLEFGPNTLRYGYNFEQLLPVNSWGMEFILPTNESIDLNYPYNASEAIYARVFTKEANTNVTVKYTNGTEQNYTIAAAGSSEVITINNTSNSTAKAAYISSDKPVSITAFHTSHDPGPSKEWQPGEAWLSPIEQSTRNVLISPLDFDARLMNLMIHHYFSIIVPTSSKDKTTISIDGGPVQPIQNVLKTSPNQPGFMWIADSIGGSGYSFGRYYFGDSNANENIFLNTTALVDNPDGLLVLAWGQGNYANYFYTAGSAARNLEASLYVNNIHHDIVMGQVFCASNFEFKAIFNDPNYYGSGYPKWFFNNVEDTDMAGKGITNPYIKVLEPGNYNVKMQYKDGGNIKEIETSFTVNSNLTFNTFTIPELCNSNLFNVSPPLAPGGTIISEGWQLETGVGTNIYENIGMPFTVFTSHNGRRIRYYAENDCGIAYSDSQILVVNQSVIPSVNISVKIN